jgi:hypothetical protein
LLRRNAREQRRPGQRIGEDGAGTGAEVGRLRRGVKRESPRFV